MSRAKFSVLIGVLLLNFVALSVLAIALLRRQQNTVQGIASIQLGPETLQNGIQLRVSAKDGSAEVAHIGGADCRVARRVGGAPAYMYFSIDPSFKRSGLMNVLVTVEYFDQVVGEIRLNYDGMDLPQNKTSTYHMSDDRERCLGSQRWQKAQFLARHARFQNSQHDGADFRIEPRMPELYVRRVTVQFLDEKAK